MTLTTTNKPHYQLKLKLKYGLIAYFLLFITQIIIFYILKYFGIIDDLNTDSKTHEYLTFSKLFIIAFLFAPIFEELLFRKFLWSFVRKNIVNNIYVSALLISVPFGLLHGYPNGIVLISSGLIFCWLYYKAKCIYTNIIIHALYNISLLLIYLINISIN